MTLTDIVNIIQTTRTDPAKGRFTDLAADLQKYVAMSRLLKNEKETVTSGTKLEFRIRYQTSGATRATTPRAQDSVATTDTLTSGEVPWRLVDTYFAIERSEMLVNREPQRIVNFVNEKRSDMKLDAAKKFEQFTWSKPADSSDEETPYGIPLWVVKNDTEGFTGGNPSGFTSGAGGIDSSTYPQWKNYSAKYTDISEDDLMSKWRRAIRHCEFVSPVQTEGNQGPDSWGFYTCDNVYGQLERFARLQNDNLGSDMYMYKGAITMARRPVTWVPYLDSDTSDPIYGINWKWMKFKALEGAYLYEHEPIVAPGKHRIVVTFVDTMYNLICENRREQFVLHTGA